MPDKTPVITLKTTLLLCIALFFTIQSSSQGFMYGIWGMSKNEIKAVAKGELVSETYDMLKYNRDWGEINTEIWYRFENGRYFAGNIIFDDLLHDYFTVDNCIDLFMQFYDSYIESYGDPFDEMVYWSDSTYYNQPEKHPVAVSKHQLSMAAGWIFKYDEIILILMGENDHVTLSISFLRINPERDLQLPYDRPDRIQIDKNLGKTEDELPVF